MSPVGINNGMIGTLGLVNPNGTETFQEKGTYHFDLLAYSPNNTTMMDKQSITANCGY